MASHDVRFVVQFDDKGAIKSIQTFDKAIEDLGKTAKDKTAPAVSGMWKQFTFGQIAANAAMDAMRGFKNELLSTVKAAMDQENADRALQSSLELTGREVEGNVKHFKQYASSLQSATIYADEQIQAAQTLLVQMTSLSRDGIDRATRGAIGLASVMKMDLQSATMLVQKALEGNFGALSRYGIRVNETLSLEEKRVQLLDKLEVMFGRATAETDTFEGRLKQLNNTWGDFKEKVGAAVTQSGILQRALENLTISVTALSAEAEPLPEKMTFWEKVASGVQGVIGPIAQAAATTKKWGDETFVLADEWRVMQNAVLTGRQAAIDPLPDKIEIVVRSLRAMKAETKGAAAAFKDMADASIDAASAVEFAAVEFSMFPADDMTAALDMIPPYLREIMGETASVGLQAQGTADVWGAAMESMTAGLVSFGDSNATVWENIGAVFGNFVKSAISGMEAVWLRQILVSKGIVKAKQGEATASHIANIFRSVPFPLDLILAAGAFAVVNALFSKLLKFEKGGYFPHATMLPAHMVGEAGPEYYLPEVKLEKTLERVIVKERGDGRGGSGAVVNFGQGAIVVYAQTLDDATIAKMGPKLYQAIDNQMRIHGRRLG